jgi:hypothetical protein
MRGKRGNAADSQAGQTEKASAREAFKGAHDADAETLTLVTKTATAPGKKPEVLGKKPEGRRQRTGARKKPRTEDISSLGN